MGNLAYAPAKAADLGGGCCADLEERVAELEATTARKGNRVVSLQVYGAVNKALMIWDDGIDSDAFIVDNDGFGGRLGFTGKATIRPGWTAGYLLEVDYQDAASDKVNNGIAAGGEQNGDDVNSFTNPAVNNGEIVIRYNNFYIEGERIGRFTVGQGSTAADGAHEVVLANSLRNSDAWHGNAFIIRGSTGSKTLSNAGQAGNSFAGDLDGGRDQVIRYDSPELYGFIVSASWGDNDYADVALRFKKEWNSIRVAAAVAYQWDDTHDATLASVNPITGAVTGYDPTSALNEGFETFGGSISAMHIPTGIYVAFSAATRSWDDDRPDTSFWYVQGGFERKLLPYGTTTIYGEYGQYDDFAFSTASTTDGAGTVTTIDVTGSQATRWGFGVVQKVDSAAMDIYAQYTHWSFDDDILTTVDPVVGATTITPGHDSLEDFTTVVIGSRIRF